MIEYTSGAPSPTHHHGDANVDGMVNLEDSGLLKDHFGHTTGASPLWAVPEPAALFSIVGIVVPMLPKRRAST